MQETRVTPWDSRNSLFGYVTFQIRYVTFQSVNKSCFKTPVFGAPLSCISKGIISVNEMGCNMVIQPDRFNISEALDVKLNLMKFNITIWRRYFHFSHQYSFF